MSNTPANPPSPLHGPSLSVQQAQLLMLLDGA
jgi:hypothetical protein